MGNEYNDIVKRVGLNQGMSIKNEWLARLAVLNLSTLLTVGFAEVLVRTFTQFPIHEPLNNRVLDDRLLFRVSGRVNGIDRGGFRNPPGYDMPFPRFAAIGDSHTFGYNVGPDKSWPRQLEQMLGAKVYNFGVGGYDYLNNAAAAELA